MKSFKDYAKILEQLNEVDNAGSYIDFDETLELDGKLTRKFVEPLKDAGDKEWLENDYLIATFAATYSSAGFINGFIRAMCLMYEAAAIQEEAKAV